MKTTQLGMPARLLASMVLAAALAACGGGGGGTATTADAGGGGNQTAPATPVTPPSTAVRITKLMQQAMSNVSYIVATVAASMTDEVVITLPASPVAGDTVRVQGESAIRWKIAQNAGQVVDTKNIPGNLISGEKWTPQDDPAVQNWWFVASSANGMKLAAVANSSGYRVPGAPETGAIWTSTDAGATWTERPGTGPKPWASIASSADGSTLAAVATNAGLWTSYDSGNTWTQRQDNYLFWVSITMSSDGMRMAAVDLGGLIHTSTDAGKTWVGQTASGVHNWRSIASSADGLKLVAVAADGESPGPAQPLYVSTDAGVRWAPSTQLFTSAYRVASSRDGTKLVMAERFGKVWTSSDSGVTWIDRFSLDRGFNAVASSADGTTLIVVAPNDTTAENVTRDGKLRVSTDSGATWKERASIGLWRGAAMSADGNLLFAGINNGVIYRSTSNRTTPGTAGFVGGGQTNDITLRYLGNGLFDATSATGPAFTIN